MRFTSLSVLVALTCLAPMAAGCAPADEEESAGASADALSLANSEYESILDDIEEATKDCDDSGCAPAGTSETTLGTQSLHPLAGRGTRRRPPNLCSSVRPFAGLASPYFFVGVSGELTAIRKLLDGGVDLVFDLKNQQAALFHYHSQGYSNLVGLEANAYSGYAFGRKANVISAWSGTFESGQASVEVPVLKIGVGGSIFRSPDNSVIGGAVKASIGLNALGPLGVIGGAIEEGEWEAWDSATRAYGRTLALSRYREGTARAHGKSHVYLQFNGARDLGVALIQTAGITLGGGAAAHAAGIAALRSAGLTVEQACPGR